MLHKKTKTWDRNGCRNYRSQGRNGGWNPFDSRVPRLSKIVGLNYSSLIGVGLQMHCCHCAQLWSRRTWRTLGLHFWPTQQDVLWRHREAFYKQEGDIAAPWLGIQEWNALGHVPPRTCHSNCCFGRCWRAVLRSRIQNLCLVLPIVLRHAFLDGRAFWDIDVPLIGERRRDSQTYGRNSRLVCVPVLLPVLRQVPEEVCAEPSRMPSFLRLWNPKAGLVPQLELVDHARTKQAPRLQSWEIPMWSLPH